MKQTEGGLFVPDGDAGKAEKRAKIKERAQWAYATAAQVLVSIVKDDEGAAIQSLPSLPALAVEIMRQAEKIDA